MDLSTQQILSAVSGAVYTTEDATGLCFHRFTREQEDLYREYNAEFRRRASATAGVKLQFRTDSPWLNLKVNALQAMLRTYFAVDVAVDGVCVGSICNMPEELPEDYTMVPCELGPYEQRFLLGDGVKTVSVYFPWTSDLRLEAVSLEAGTLFEPTLAEKTLLMFGDSITQGYDAIHPSKRYGALLADALGAREINKAIGGEIFFPPLARSEEDLEPDYITVAYGTNDWNGTTPEVMKKHAREFYSALQNKYPRAKLFALLPIWRKDRDEERPYGNFDQMRQDLAAVAKDLGISVIDCYDFVPKDPSYFADLRLHPNDRGFEAYADHLAKAILAEVAS